MPKSKLQNSTELLLNTVFDAMHEKKAEHVLLLDLSEIKGANFDYFVIANGNSTTQVNAIAEEVRRKTKLVCHLNPAHAEGFANAEWILLDYLDVVVHIFQKEVREHYQLENLWADAVITPITEEPATKITPAKNIIKKELAKKTVKETAKKRATSDERKSTQSKPKSTVKSQFAKSAKSKI